MRIYTKTGDDGETGLISGERTLKSSERIETLGEIDELNAAFGILRTYCEESPEAHLDETRIQRTQELLFELGSEIATPFGSPYAKDSVLNSDLDSLEKDIDEWTEQMEVLKQFILPGGTKMSAHAHLCRTICRRAERCLVNFIQNNPDQQIRPITLHYLNRLSDWLFVYARWCNHRVGIKDIQWNSRK